MSNRWHYTIRNVASISACTQKFHTLFYNYESTLKSGIIDYSDCTTTDF